MPPATTTSIPLSASYVSPVEDHTFSYPLNTNTDGSGSGSSSVEGKVSYLSNLRASTKTLQDDVNAFLTAKMAEDKAKETASAPSSVPAPTAGAKKAKGAGVGAGGKGKRKTREEEEKEEEENYGEEKIDDDG